MISQQQQTNTPHTQALVPTYRIPERVVESFTSKVANLENPYTHHVQLAPMVASILIDALKESNTSEARSIIQLLADVKSGEGPAFFAFNNAPHDIIPDSVPTPNTSDHYKDVSAGRLKGFISEYFLLAINTLLDLTLITDPGMQNGLPFHQGIPLPASVGQVTNSTPGSLPLHTETAYKPDPPHFIALAGLRQGAGHTWTDIVPLQAILDRLTGDEIIYLSMPVYAFSSGASLTTGTAEKTSSILTCNAAGRVVSVRFIDDAQRLTADDSAPHEAAAALAKLRTILNDCREDRSVNLGRSLQLRPGVVAVLNNQLVVHGRTMDEDAVGDAMRPDANSSRRWLLRTYSRRAQP